MQPVLSAIVTLELLFFVCNGLADISKKRIDLTAACWIQDHVPSHLLSHQCAPWTLISIHSFSENILLVNTWWSEVFAVRKLLVFIVRFAAQGAVNPSDISQLEGTYAIKPPNFPAVPGTEGLGLVTQVTNVSYVSAFNLLLYSLSCALMTRWINQSSLESPVSFSHRHLTHQSQVVWLWSLVPSWPAYLPRNIEISLISLIHCLIHQVLTVLCRKFQSHP